jgi:hypothetical protein
MVDFQTSPYKKPSGGISMDKQIRGSVGSFYAEAAAEPKPTLCCPASYNEEEVSHIPKEVLDISYGCGSPVGLADIREGENVLDLGSGGGIGHRLLYRRQKGGERGQCNGCRYD